MGNDTRARLAVSTALIAALAVAGCSGTTTAPEPEPAPAATSEGTGAQSEGPAEGGGYASKEPLELKIHLHYNDTTVFKDDWATFRQAAEMTNVTLKGTASETATNSNEVFNLMLASGSLPDIIHGNKDPMNEAGIDGALIPLDELIEEHAPNIKKFFEEHDWALKGSLNSDGKLYYIPFVMDGEASTGFFIRQDWLDKLGLPVPTTVDAYYETLVAIRDGDPNGNGQKDEVPYFNRNTAGALDLVQLFGGHTGWYEDGGTVRYGKYEPAYKTAMAELARWYAEGLIDKEIFTRGGKAREMLLGNNTGGSTHDWFGSTASYNDRLQADVPGLSFLPIAPPADVNGVVKEMYSRSLLPGKGWGISYSNKHPVETIKYFDFWFTEAGRRLNNFGVEGVHYDMVDGKPMFKAEVLNGELPVNTFLYGEGAQIEIGFQQDFSYEEQWLNPIARDGMRMYIDNDYFMPQFPPVSFTEEEQAVITQKWTAINTFIQETEQKWIMGAEPVEPNFDAYIRALKNMGMDEIVAIYNAAYQRYNAK